jgi:S-DNA-T family DNA segregation ATPase FtsK/SpoIIIE
MKKNQMVVDYFTISLSVDSLGWTELWLDDRFRCDLLVVKLNPDENAKKKIKIIAVEAKGRSGKNPPPLDSNRDPYKHAITQVGATLDALREILDPDAPRSLTSDLKLGALFQHLTSETLTKIGSITTDDKDRKIRLLERLTELSQRRWKLGSGLELSGMVVATWIEASVDQTTILEKAPGEFEWPIRLYSCGTPKIRELFESPADGQIDTIAEVVDQVEKQGVGTESQATDETEPPPVKGVTDTPESETAPGKVAPPTATKVAPADELSNDEPITQIQNTQTTIDALMAACRQRGFPVRDVNKEFVREGPTLLTVPVILQAGESLSPIKAAVDDMARDMGLGDEKLSVENDPDRAHHIRFLVPRPDRMYPALPEGLPTLFEDDDLGRYLGVSLGMKVDGTPYRSFLSDWPHLLVAGTTGSGKTTLLKSILLQFNEVPQQEIQVAIVDGKDGFDYQGLVDESRFPKQFPEVLIGHEYAPDVLKWVIEEEVKDRQQALKEYFTKNPKAPRSPKKAYITARLRNEPFPISPIIVVIDEFADIMLASGTKAREFETLVQRVVQRGRSALVHLILATQRPDAKVLAGAIKANLPSRVALKLPGHHDSQVAINQTGAEDLLGTGDMLFDSGTGTLLRLQGYRTP